MKRSAGILLYKLSDDTPLFFLVHPGGPFWKNKDAGSWSIPKGEFSDDEEPLAAAIREFREETGISLNAPTVDFVPLAPVRLKSGKLVHAWLLEHDADISAITSNEFQVEWPPRSGKMQSFPEIDKAGWFAAEEALEKIHEAQRAFLLEAISLRKSLD